MRYALLALLLSAASACAQEVRSVPAAQTSAASGQEMFRTYCASCHGVEGKGNGPASPALKTRPTDLTQLARRNSGQFPALRVFNAIAGDANVPAHGSKNMPVWGPLLRSLSESDPQTAKLRIRNLTKYIESIQAK